MKKPKISCICLTFARVPLLQEALACFLSQVYDGKKELIIYNSFAEQELVFEHPEVKVFNVKERPASIGEARNAAIELATGDWVCTFDDDDKTLPNHLENITHGVDLEHHNWSWLSHQFFMEADVIKSIVAGTPNVFSYSKAAWKAVGGFHFRNVGEDSGLVGRITEKFAGTKIELDKRDISFLYQWGQGAYHISGQGEQANDTVIARTDEFVRQQKALGRIPVGRIELVPKLLADYRAIADRFTGSVTKLEEAKIGKVAILLLGRFGDLVNILPVARELSRRAGQPIHFVTSRQFASVLEGVSYVIPDVLDLPHDRVNEAREICSKKYTTTVCAQVWGHNFSTSRESSIYNVESWRVAGFLSEFNNTHDFPLVFDRRSPERERALSESLPMAGKPVVLVNIGGGHTAPYSGANIFFQSLQSAWSHDFNILDISEVRAERIYDLLGLFDRAALLVSNDTATIHLAAASDIPVIFLSNSIPWLSSATRCNVVLRLDYDSALRRMSEVNAVLQQLKVSGV